MEATELPLEESLRVVDASLSRIKWRLRPSSKRRLQTDTLALCFGMRPVVMIDYGGKMPELVDHLCNFVSHCKKESLAFEFLRVMVIDDMVYLVHVREFADFIKSSLNMETEVLFVDLEIDPPQMITQAEESFAWKQLVSVQKLFSSFFDTQELSCNQLESHKICTSVSSLDEHATYESSELFDLSYCLQDSDVTIPTLNGWLLGYPTIYLFGKDCIEQAIYNLSTKSLHVYQVFAHRVGAGSKGHRREELMSFTVPYELSLEGSDEAWAKAFLARMQARWDKCRHVWESLHMEVLSSPPQAIAL